jgi:glycerophosphoryl diester phosphodiesterase
MESPYLPLVIGHRGAPGHLPEHSAAGYRLAVELGADAVETDVVMSRDGVLVVRHENELSRTTDIARRPEFAHLRTTKTIAGKKVSGWFTEDLTFAELRTLGAPTEEHPLMSLDELLLLVADESHRAGRRIGLHVEVKHPAYFTRLGLPMTELLLHTLRDHGVSEPGSRVWLQSFDAAYVRHLEPLTDLPLVQLMDEGWGPVDLIDWDSIAAYADAVGPRRTMIRPNGQPPTTLVLDAHDAGLKVFVWTLKKGERQARNFFDQRVDGVFSDVPDTAVAALRRLRVEETA